VIADVRLVCEDNLPYHLIATHGEDFTLTWQEKHPSGWAPQRRSMGVEARALVGKPWHHPLLLQAMGFDPTAHTVVAGSPYDDFTVPPARAPR
jgi:hypothetical protein